MATQKQIKKQIRDLGLKVSYDPEWGQWRVTTSDDSEDIAYYTPDPEDALATAQDMAKRLAANPRACAIPGPLSTKARDRLPDKAFGLPEERKYPMYRMVRQKVEKKEDGESEWEWVPVPSGSHASNAKARAQAQFDDGSLTKANLEKIDRKADKVLKECGTTGKKRKENVNVVEAFEAGGYTVEIVRDGDSLWWMVSDDDGPMGTGDASSIADAKRDARARLDEMGVPRKGRVGAAKRGVARRAIASRTPNPGIETAGSLVARLKF